MFDTPAESLRGVDRLIALAAQYHLTRSVFKVVDGLHHRLLQKSISTHIRQPFYYICNSEG